MASVILDIAMALAIGLTRFLSQIAIIATTAILTHEHTAYGIVLAVAIAAYVITSRYVYGRDVDDPADVSGGEEEY